jgi:hypothetical protein
MIPSVKVLMMMFVVQKAALPLRKLLIHLFNLVLFLVYLNF